MGIGYATEGFPPGPCGKSYCGKPGSHIILPANINPYPQNFYKSP